MKDWLQQGDSATVETMKSSSAQLFFFVAVFTLNLINGIPQKKWVVLLLYYKLFVFFFNFVLQVWSFSKVFEIGIYTR